MRNVAATRAASQKWAEKHPLWEFWNPKSSEQQEFCEEKSSYDSKER
jgi:hypothetical protein